MVENVAIPKGVGLNGFSSGAYRQLDWFWVERNSDNFFGGLQVFPAPLT